MVTVDECEYVQKEVEYNWKMGVCWENQQRRWHGFPIFLRFCKGKIYRVEEEIEWQ